MGSCVFADDLHLDTDVLHLEKGKFEIWICTHWSQGYPPFGSYEKWGRTHVEIYFFSHERHLYPGASHL